MWKSVNVLTLMIAVYVNSIDPPISLAKILLNWLGGSTGLTPAPIRSTRPLTTDRTRVRSCGVTRRCRTHLPSPSSRTTSTGPIGGPTLSSALTSGTAPMLPSFSARSRNPLTFRLQCWLFLLFMLEKCQQSNLNLKELPFSFLHSGWMIISNRLKWLTECVGLDKLETIIYLLYCCVCNVDVDIASEPSAENGQSVRIEQRQLLAFVSAEFQRDV